MDNFNNELQQKLQGKVTLRRTPAPKPPGNKNDNQPGGELFSIKLKPVGTNHSESKPVDNDESKENASNNKIHERKPRPHSIQDRSKLFENGSPGKPLVPQKPGVAKKPVIVPKPAVAEKPIAAVSASSAQNKEIKRARPPSVLNKPVQKIDESYKDTRVPDLLPLPPESVLGSPPQKPPKLWSLKPSVKKYLGTSYPARPMVSGRSAARNSKLDEVEPEPLAPDFAPPIPTKPKPIKQGQAKKENEDSRKDNSIHPTNDSITEEFYDDTACSTSNFPASEEFYDDTACTTSNFPASSEEFYDDTACSTSNMTENSDDFYDDTACTNDFGTSGVQDESFGGDIYEPIANQEELSRDLPAEKPPTLPAKDHGKEDKKKKERERKKKEKELKEEKEREEKEKKKREKEKDKKISEMKRRFSVRGNEKSIGTCIAAEDIPGNRMDIAAYIGEEFGVIRKGKPNPSNKWLVRNKQGQYGFIDTNKIEKDAEDSEDLYEEVPASKLKPVPSFNSDHISTPPVTSPPPPPAQNHPMSSSGQQDIYDDVAGQDAEELYEFLPDN